MELTKNQWYVRWFFWSLAVCDEFVPNNSSWRYRSGTNLCHFCRTLFWGTAVLLVHVAFYGSAIGVVSVLPIYLFGFGGYLWTLFCMGAFVLFIMGTKLLWVRFVQFMRRRNELKTEAPPVQPTRQGPSFFKVLWQYVVAVKGKFCPVITFTEGATS